MIIGVLASGGLAPLAPTIGTATAGDASATVTYTAPSWAGKGAGAVTYTATSSPGGFTGTGSSPITVSGLTNGTAYTFTVTATTSYGVTGPASAASNSVTPALQDAGAMFPIRSYVVPSAGAASVTFSLSGITGYTHLQFRIFARTNYTTGTTGNDGTYMMFEFNSDTTSNYKPHWLQGNGSTATAATSSTNPAAVVQRISTADATSGVFGSVIVDVLDYTNTNKYKTLRSLGGLDNNGGGRIYMTSGLWMSTNAITSIKITPGEGTAFSQYSSFALYGVKA